MERHEFPLQAGSQAIATAQEPRGDGAARHQNGDQLRAGGLGLRQMSGHGLREVGVHFLRRLAEGKLPQRDDILSPEKVGERLGNLFLAVNISALQPVKNRIRSEVLQFDFVSAVHHRVRNGFPHPHARHLEYNVVQAFADAGCSGWR